MKRQAACLFVSIAIGLGAGNAALAAGATGGAKDTAAPGAKAAAGDATTAADAAGAGGDADTGAAGDTGELDLSDKGDQTAEQGAAAVKASSTLTWQDIIVIPRKRFLKGGRFELAPFTGMSVNDILVQHFVFGVDLNYFLTDALSLGVQGSYYIKHLTDREADIGLQYDRIPTLNRYLWNGSVNFGYVPAYGKFAWFNRSILHWEILASAGVGLTQTEIIPRDIALAAFQTRAITPNFGLGARFFMFDWLTVNFTIRDYVIPDKFEPLSRSATMYASASDAQGHAESKWVNNVMFYLGVGVFLPTGFQYKTPR